MDTFKKLWSKIDIFEQQLKIHAKNTTCNLRSIFSPISYQKVVRKFNPLTHIGSYMTHKYILKKIIEDVCFFDVIKFYV